MTNTTPTEAPPQSKELSEFYAYYAQWLDDGAPQFEPFSRYEGLCWAIQFFAHHAGYGGKQGEGITKLRKEFDAQLEAAGLHKHYPFHNGQGMQFSAERTRGETHLNERRNQWVKEHVHADPEQPVQGAD